MEALRHSDDAELSCVLDILVHTVTLPRDGPFLAFSEQFSWRLASAWSSGKSSEASPSVSRTRGRSLPKTVNSDRFASLRSALVEREGPSIRAGQVAGVRDAPRQDRPL